MKPQLSQTFGNNLSIYLNATSEQCMPAPENHQTIDQLPRRRQSQMWRITSERACLHGLSKCLLIEK